jgi:hypothetical protein
MRDVGKTKIVVIKNKVTGESVSCRVKRQNTIPAQYAATTKTFEKKIKKLGLPFNHCIIDSIEIFCIDSLFTELRVKSYLCPKYDTQEFRFVYGAKRDTIDLYCENGSFSTESRLVIKIVEVIALKDYECSVFSNSIDAPVVINWCFWKFLENYQQDFRKSDVLDAMTEILNYRVEKGFWNNYETRRIIEEAYEN